MDAVLTVSLLWRLNKPRADFLWYKAYGESLIRVPALRYCMESQTAYDAATEYRDAILEAVDLPDGWEEADEEYPFREEVPDDFPDDYNYQYEVAGFTDGESYAGVWWLRDGERFQVYYDSSAFGEWSDVYDVDEVVDLLAEL